MRAPRLPASVEEQVQGADPGRPSSVPHSSAVRENVATSSAWALLASKVLSEIYVDYAETYPDSFQKAIFKYADPQNILLKTPAQKIKNKV